MSSNSLLRRLAFCLLMACIIFVAQHLPAAAGLTCYETDPEGNANIVQNAEWTLCALVPSMQIGDEHVNGSQFGLGPENDMLTAYNTAFAMSVADEYRILTVCIYERYNFGTLMPMLKAEQAVEFTFRCVCNTDLCNTGPQFAAYLGTLKAHSFERQK